ncbi:MAG: 3-isopropylmalate dehydrogenase, partial [Campylobacter sp.]|nr:3-isopropylmalate dehydrogenase [Campylobacter sp.]
MDRYKICVIKGDGIGPEIADEAIKVLDSVSAKFGFGLDYEYFLMGGAAIDVFGVPLPDDTLNAAKASDAVLFGAIGGPKWDNLDPSIRPEKGLLKIRKELEAFANLRPAIIFDELINASTIKPEIIKGVDVLIVRELTGGLYFGEPRAMGKDKAYNTMLYSRSEIERIAKVAFVAAGKRRGKLCVVDKANVLETSRLWREVVGGMAASYPDVSVEYMYVDNAAMQLIRNPRQFDVILTENLFGDILSD